MKFTTHYLTLIVLDASSKLSMKVNLNHPTILYHLAVDYDRKSSWYEHAINRQHFQRRIQRIEKVLLPVLSKRIIQSHKV